MFSTEDQTALHYQTTKKRFAGLISIGFFFIFIIPANFSCKKDSNSTNTKIVYTDLNPDSTITGNESIYLLDLNHDGINDFLLETFFGRLPCTIGGPTGQQVLMPVINVVISPFNANSIGDTTIMGGLRYPIMLAQGRIINKQSFGWSDSAGQIMVRVNDCTQYHAGQWSGSIDQFLPLKLDVGTSIYYGWIRMDVGVNGVSVTIKDCAFNSISNQAIFAGQIK